MIFKTEKQSLNRISEEKKHRIFQAAIKEFAEHGYESANINIIAKNADVSVGAMYKYFDSKEDLYFTIVHFCVERLKAILDETILGEDSLMGKIKKIIEAIQLYSRSNADLNKIYNVMTTESRSEVVWKIVSDMEGITADLYTSLIDEGKKTGEIREDIDSKLFAYFLDNIFILLQFSYSCEYYKQRLKMFAGITAFDNDELVASELIKFIEGAFLRK